MNIIFPDPASQTPLNTFSPTSSPSANTTNNYTYVFDGLKGVWISSPQTQDIIPSGSKLTFHNASAPLGWTQDTTFNNGAIRVVSGTGGGSGGTSNFSAVFTSRTPTISSHTLTEQEMPIHVHTYNGVNSTGSAGGSNINPYISTASYSTGSAGSSVGHSHGASAMDFDVKYINMILCSKD